MSSDEPRSQIVYDDPGSVTDIRKRFGQIKGESAAQFRPKPLISPRPRPGSIKDGSLSPRPITPSRKSSSSSSGNRSSFNSFKDRPNSEAYESIHEDFTQSTQIAQQQFENSQFDFPKPPPQVASQKPALRPKPALPARKFERRRSSNASSVYVVESAPNDALVEKMNAISLSETDDFDEAVREFYRNLQIFESTR
ncbi:Oidioi.mRNA.OKI2018_I69.chr2.g4608.t1.cds [Oikopleura dioica]|uniref:Oidioi.mRNA.OKI2018_I69.chr2.g4608.t1.cds n=1 Tax=Oikopleura dioica TaxID=34765 RepID=A0ABN7T6Z7_OIKDI|nr:Oidioi.mRNA.OKI2018_I69.chr2.g4608.t1.cds [Oikopleura dioica]